jgi:hypothetical protein
MEAGLREAGDGERARVSRGGGDLRWTAASGLVGKGNRTHGGEDEEERETETEAVRVRERRDGNGEGNRTGGDDFCSFLSFIPGFPFAPLRWSWSPPSATLIGNRNSFKFQPTIN